jgi:hypothetical protein
LRRLSVPPPKKSITLPVDWQRPNLNSDDSSMVRQTFQSLGP